MSAGKFQTWVAARTSAQISVGLFLIAFAVRIVVIFVGRGYLDQERFELERVAISVAQNGLFGDPYAIPTGPTAHVSPGWPLILALIFKIFGTGTGGEIAKRVFTGACSAAICAFIPVAGRAFRFPNMVGVGAGLFAALLPLKIRTETEGDWEAPFTALGMMLILSLAVVTWREKRFDVRWGAVVGLPLGIVLLFSWPLMPIVPLLLITGFIAIEHTRRVEIVKFAGVVSACAILALAPWAYRNQRALGSIVWGRDNLGLELRQSNNDDAVANEHENLVLGNYRRYHPMHNPTEALKVRDMGEVAYNRALLDETRQWVVDHPMRFMQLCLERAVWFWLYPEFGTASGLMSLATTMRTLIFVAITVLGFAGLGMIFRRQRAVFVAIVIALAVASGPDYFVWVGVRHRFVIDWLLTLLASLAVWRLSTDRRERIV